MSGVCIQVIVNSNPLVFRLYSSDTISKQFNHAHRLIYSAKCFMKFSSWAADACECGNEPSGSVKCGGFLD
jgi:hypothetical protein